MRTPKFPLKAVPALPLWILDAIILAVILSPNAAFLLHATWIPPVRRATLFAFDMAMVALPLFAIGSRWKYLLAAFAAAFAPFELLQILRIGSPSTQGVIGSVLDTNPSEAWEWISACGWAFLAMTCLALLVLAISWRRARRDGRERSVRQRLLGAGLCVLLAAPEFAHIHRLPIDRFWSMIQLRDHFEDSYPFGFLRKFQLVESNRIHLDSRNGRIQGFDWQVGSPPAPRRPMTLVLVLGESSRSSNWSLHGYGRPTTPLLQAVPDLLVFGNATSASNITSEALPLMLGLAEPSSPSVFDTTPSILHCLRKSGFRTWWISNQCRYGSFDSKPAMIGKEAQSTVFLTDNIRNQESGAYDERLLPLLRNALRTPVRPSSSCCTPWAATTSTGNGILGRSSGSRTALVRERTRRATTTASCTPTGCSNRSGRSWASPAPPARWSSFPTMERPSARIADTAGPSSTPTTTPARRKSASPS